MVAFGVASLQGKEIYLLEFISFIVVTIYLVFPKSNNLLYKLNIKENIDFSFKK